MLSYLIPKFLPILLLLGIGLLLKRARFISESSIQDLKKFVVNISLPALLFFSFLEIDFQLKYILVIALIFFLNVLMLVIGKLLQKILKADSAYFPIMFTGFEMGMLGFSLYGSVYGPENLSYIGVLDLGQEVFVWFVMASMLLSIRSNAINLKTSVKNFVTSPVIIAIFSGILLNVSGLNRLLAGNALYDGCTSTLSMLSQITIPFILIIIGYQLNLRFSRLKLPFLTIVLRLSFMIALGLIIDALLFRQLLRLDGKFSIALFTLLILPPPYIIPLFMEGSSVDSEEYVGNTLSLGTLITIIGFFALVVLYSL